LKLFDEFKLGHFKLWVLILIAVTSNMPTAIVSTNVASDRVKDTDFALHLSKAVAETVRKPEQYVMTHVNSNQVMTYSGNQEPCAFVRIISIGNLDAGANATISARVCGLVEEVYNVPPARTYIEFVDSERHMFGWNGGTF